jgi:hypothetical protein
MYLLCNREYVGKLQVRISPVLLCWQENYIELSSLFIYMLTQQSKVQL